MDAAKKESRGPSDRVRINMHEGYDVRYWANEFSISAERLKEITGRVGDKVEDVRQDLASRHTAG